MKSMRVLMCVVVLASVATATVGAPLRAAETSTSTSISTSTSTTIIISPAVSSQPFTWSKRALTVGATLKASKLVSSQIKGTRTYRATGACSLRKGVLSFKRTGKCRVSVSVTAKGTKKITRSSKLFTVKAKTSVFTSLTSGMPDPIGCTQASSHPQTGVKYPDSSPGDYEFQTAWNCDKATLDARPLLEYFKSQGWTQKSTTMGMSTAQMTKGSGYLSYGTHADVLPEGQTFLILTIS